MRSLEECNRVYQALSKEKLSNYRSQANARYILYGVQESNMPHYASNLDASLELMVYIYLGLGIDYANYEEFVLSEKCFEKAGELTEQMHRDKNHQCEMSFYALLIGSLAYYCAGQCSKAYVLAKEIPDGLPIANMIKHFINKKFEMLQEDICAELLQDIGNYTPSMRFAQSLTNVIGYLQNGDSALLHNGINILKKIQRQALSYGQPDVWWVSKLLGYILERLGKTSLWVHIPRLGDKTNAIIVEYIHYLFYSRNVIELFKTQIEALNIILNGEGAVISLPTSSGKTRIAEMAILKELMAAHDSAILYLAPYKSLAFEIENDFGEIFPRLGVGVTHLYGNNDFSTADKQAMEESSIWIATPEKAKAIYRGGGFSKSISLVIMDEGHLIDESERNVTNEIFVEELREIVKQMGGHFLVLSAVLPNAEDIAGWLTNSSSNKEVSDWRVSSQRKGLIINEPGNIHLSWAEDDSCFNRSFIKGELNWKQACAAIAKRFQSFGSVLLFVAKKTLIPGQAEAIYELLTDEDDVDWGDDVDWQRFVLKSEEENGADIYLKYAKKGIICHNAGFTDSYRLSLEKLLRKGKAKYIVASSTLAQGVNIGVSTVVFVNVDMGRFQYINKRDFWNIAGRAGRAFVDTEGKILYYVDARNLWMKRRERERAWDYMRSSQLEDVKSGVLGRIEKVLMILKELNYSDEQVERMFEDDMFEGIDNDMTIKNFVDIIDDALISLDLSVESNDNRVEECINGCLSIRQAPIGKKDLYKRVLKARIRRNRRFAGDDGSLFVCTGMSLRDSTELYRQRGNIDNIIQNYMNSAMGIDDFERFVDQMEDVVLSLPSDRLKKADKKVLNMYRLTWLSGGHIDKTTKEKVLKDFYSLSLSWVLNSLMGYYVGNDEVRTMLMKVNKCVQNGLPTYWAYRIYASGIESRLTALELSTIIPDMSNERRYNIRIAISRISDVLEMSERAKKWIELLRKEMWYLESQATSFRNCGELNIPECIDENLYINSLGNDVYIRNLDFSYTLKVGEDILCLKELSNKLGVYLLKDGDKYKVVSDNYKYRVKNQG